MRAIKVFILGVIFGVYLKWIIDEIYVRDNLRRIADENSQLRDRIKQLDQSRSPETRTVQRTTPVPQPDQRPVPARTTKSVPRTSRKDDLKKIKGIGPVMEKKLNAAGIHTYEQFSRLTTQELQNVLGISRRVVQSADNLITQARNLSQQKSKR